MYSLFVPPRHVSIPDIFKKYSEYPLLDNSVFFELDASSWRSAHYELFSSESVFQETKVARFFCSAK